jgi:hypothetical protein
MAIEATGEKNRKAFFEGPVSSRRSFETHPVLEIVFHKFFQKCQI